MSAGEAAHRGVTLPSPVTVLKAQGEGNTPLCARVRVLGVVLPRAPCRLSPSISVCAWLTFGRRILALPQAEAITACSLLASLSFRTPSPSPALL